MTIEVCTVSSEEASRIVAIEEGHFVDVKGKRISPAKLSRHLTAFANADGGELFVGIDDDPRRWNGFTKLEEANGHIQAFDSIFQLSQDAEYQFLKCGGFSGFVLKISVRKSQTLRRTTDGKIYARRNAQSNVVAASEALRILEFAKGVHSFESTTSTATVDRILDSDTYNEFMDAVVPHQDKFKFLKKQELVAGDKVTVAGCLLFDDLPQAILPSRSGIKVYRYKTSANSGTRDVLAFDPKSIEGPVCALIRDAVEETKRLVEQIEKMGPDGLESVSYPSDALHEIVANAVLHRDYSIADDVHIRIFDNRVEVESPGRLPAHITPENILDERFVRNGSVFRLVSKFPDPPNKGVGEGLNTAFRAMQDLKLKDPQILQEENAVVVVLKHESLASPEMIIVEYLQRHPTIKNKEAREICHIAEDWRVKNIFERMTKAGIIERVPGTDRATTAYRLRSNTGSETRDNPRFEENLFASDTPPDGDVGHTKS